MVQSAARRASIAGGSTSRRNSIIAPIKKLFRRSAAAPIHQSSRLRPTSLFTEDPYKEIRAPSESYVDINPFNIESDRPLSFLQTGHLAAIDEDEPEITYTYRPRKRSTVVAIQGREVNKLHRASMMSLSQLGGYKNTAEREAEIMMQVDQLQHLGREEEIQKAMKLLENKIMAQNNSYLQQFYEDDSIEYTRKLSVG